MVTGKSAHSKPPCSHKIHGKALCRGKMRRNNIRRIHAIITRLPLISSPSYIQSIDFILS